MRRLVVKILKNETILVVASILALISCFIVPPDKEYAGYIHASTISQLICLMLVVCGFQRIGVFRIIGSRLLHHVSTARGLVITLISLTYFSGMLITNDVALVTFIPFAIAVLTMAHMEEHAVLVGTLMTVGANVGSMLTPIGNAHNLYLKALTGMPSAEMIGIMAPYSVAAAVLLVVIVCVVFGKKPVSEFSSIDGSGIEQNVLAPNSDQPQPDEIRVTGCERFHSAMGHVRDRGGGVPVLRSPRVPQYRLGIAAHVLHVLHFHRQYETRAGILRAGRLLGGGASAGSVRGVQPVHLQRADHVAAVGLLRSMACADHRHQPWWHGYADRIHGVADRLQERDTRLPGQERLFGRRPVSLTANLKVAGSHLLLGLHENPWNHWISRVYCYVG